MERKPVACLEITNLGLKLLIGYELQNKPIVLFYRFIPLEKGVISHGVIAKPDILSSALRQICSIVDSDDRLKIKLQHVNLVIPSIGLKVYSAETSFNVVGDKVEEVDIAHLISVIRKENAPAGYTISDIIPIMFALDDGRHFAAPPLGYVSKTVAMKAMVHTLPESMHGQHQTAVNAVQLRVLKSCVSVYTAAKFFASCDYLPKDYIYLDIGGCSSDLALIGNGEPYAANSFARGSDDLTEAIASAFHISHEDAEALKITKGYSLKDISYKPVLIIGADDEGNPKNYYQDDLNKVIEDYFATYISEINASLQTFLERYTNKSFVSSIPVIVSGGGSRLAGLRYFMEKAFPGREIYFPIPRVIGARDPGMVNLLGMLLSASSFSGSKEDLQRGVATVTREAAKQTDKKKDVKRPNRSSVEDSL